MSRRLRLWVGPPVVSDAVTYTSENVVKLVATAVIGVFIARYLGPEGLGLLNYAGAIFGFLMPASLLGMQAIIVREISATDRWQRPVASALVRQAPIALIASIAGVVLISATRDFEQEAIRIAAVMAPLPLLGLSGTIRSYLEATGRVRRIVVTGLLSTAAGAVVKVWALVTQAPIWVFALAGTIEAAVVLVGLVRGLPRGARRGLARAAEAVTGRRLFAESWPLLIAGLAVLVYMTVDVAMLGLLASDEETGIYVAAVRLSEVWYFLPMSALAAVRPRVSSAFARGAENEYQQLTQRFLTGSAAASLVIVVATLVLADPLVTLLYGESFASSASALRVHILAAPFVFVGVAASQWFIDQRLTRLVMYRSLAGAAVNIGLNLVAIPAYGASGAAFVTVLSYAFANVLANGFSARTRPILRQQVRAFRLTWR